MGGAKMKLFQLTKNRPEPEEEKKSDEAVEQSSKETESLDEGSSTEWVLDAIRMQFEEHGEIDEDMINAAPNFVEKERLYKLVHQLRSESEEGKESESTHGYRRGAKEHMSSKMAGSSNMGKVGSEYQKFVDNIGLYEEYVRYEKVPNIIGTASTEDLMQSFIQLNSLYGMIIDASDAYIDHRNNISFAKLRNRSASIKNRLRYVASCKRIAEMEMAKVGEFINFYVMEPESTYNNFGIKGDAVKDANISWLDVVTIARFETNITNYGENIGEGSNARSNVKKTKTTEESGEKTGIRRIDSTEKKARLEDEVDAENERRQDEEDRASALRKARVQSEDTGKPVENFLPKDERSEEEIRKEKEEFRTKEWENEKKKRNQYQRSVTNKSIAMDRVSKLLGTNLIASSRHAEQSGFNRSTDKYNESGEVLPDNKFDKTEDVEFMEFAKGRSVTSTVAGGYDNGDFEGYDPQFLKQTSQLTIVDLLLGQWDRHGDNVFVDRVGDEESGYEIRLTGIDNDAIGKYENNVERKNEETGKFERISFQYVDKLKGPVDADIAQKVLSIDSNVLRFLLIDIMDEEDLDVLGATLERLQKKLNSDDVSLIDEWNEPMGLAMKEHEHNYLSRWGI